MDVTFYILFFTGTNIRVYTLQIWDGSINLFISIILTLVIFPRLLLPTYQTSNLWSSIPHTRYHPLPHRRSCYGRRRRPFVTVLDLQDSHNDNEADREEATHDDVSTLRSNIVLGPRPPWSPREFCDGVGPRLTLEVHLYHVVDRLHWDALLFKMGSLHEPEGWPGGWGCSWIYETLGFCPWWTWGAPVVAADYAVSCEA